jgi:magnesium transporter
MLICQWIQGEEGAALAQRLQREPELKLALMVEPEALKDVWKAFGLPPHRAQDCLGGGTTRFESDEGYDFLTVSIPPLVGQGFHRVSILYEPRLLVIVAPRLPVLEAMQNKPHAASAEEEDLGGLLYRFLDRLTRQDILCLEALEQELSLLEESVMMGAKSDYLAQIMNLRNRMMMLKRYYVQLLRLCQDMEENENGLISGRQLKRFRMMTRRVERLLDTTDSLRDYVSQVREAYQSQVDINLNNLMRIFTVLTAVFSPLTLIVGWYGMNLRMPESRWAWGYPMVIVISLAVCVATVVLFKKKKWF